MRCHGRRVIDDVWFLIYFPTPARSRPPDRGRARRGLGPARSMVVPRPVRRVDASADRDWLPLTVPSGGLRAGSGGVADRRGIVIAVVASVGSVFHSLGPVDGVSVASAETRSAMPDGPDELPTVFGRRG